MSPENKTDNGDVITRIIVVNSENVLPSDVSMKIYHSKADVTVKESCFGIMVKGSRRSVEKIIDEVVSMDPNHIFVKDRGFSPGDERRCRAVRGGGPRPGFHFLREEINILPFISKGLEAYEKGLPSPKGFKEKNKLKASKLKELIESE